MSPSLSHRSIIGMQPAQCLQGVELNKLQRPCSPLPSQEGSLLSVKCNRSQGVAPYFSHSLCHFYFSISKLGLPYIICRGLPKTFMLSPTAVIPAGPSVRRSHRHLRGPPSRLRHPCFSVWLSESFRNPISCYGFYSAS